MEPQTEAPTGQPIGFVALISGRAYAQSGDGIRELTPGSPVYKGETLTTGAKANLEVRFVDDTLLSQGSDSSVALNQYVYDPDNPEASRLLFDMAKGMFRYVTGGIADDNPEQYQLHSPLALVGIRGTTTVHEIAEDFEKHGVEEIHAGKACLIMNREGEIREITVSQSIVDVDADGFMSPVRPFTVQEYDMFRQLSPLSMMQDARERDAGGDAADEFGPDGEDDAPQDHSGTGGHEHGLLAEEREPSNPGAEDGETSRHQAVAIVEADPGEAYTDQADPAEEDMPENSVQEQAQPASEDSANQLADASTRETAAQSQRADPASDTQAPPSETTPEPPETSVAEADQPPSFPASNTSLENGSGSVMVDGDWASFAEAGDSVQADLEIGKAMIGTSDETLPEVNNLMGSEHDDLLVGDAGDNTLAGGSGDDHLGGGDGDDLLQGGQGNDAFAAGLGSTLYGGTYVAGQGLDVFDGGEGVDTVSYAGLSFAGVDVDLASGTADDGLGGRDTLISIENVLGTETRDFISGNGLDNILAGAGGNDHLFGAGGDDLLRGDAGDDLIFGGDGRDQLYGSQGSDTLTGGAGSDMFVFDLDQEGRDLITDFTGGEDVLAFSGPGLDGFAFKRIDSEDHNAAPATDALFTYDPGTGELYFDPDGSGENEAKLIAVVQGDPVTAADIAVV